MTQTHAARESEASAPARDERRQCIAALDSTLLRLRRSFIKPQLAALPIPTLGRRVDLSKILACQALAALGHGALNWAGACGPREKQVADPAPALDDAGPHDGSVVTVKDIASALHLKQSTTSRLLGEAEADGLVERRPNPLDKRSTSLQLTADGEAVVAGFGAMRQAHIDAILRDWSTDDVEEFVAMLARFADSLEQMPIPSVDEDAVADLP